MKELSVILFSSFKFAMTFPLAILEYKMGILKTIIWTNIGGFVGILVFTFLSEQLIFLWRNYLVAFFRKLLRRDHDPIKNKRIFTPKNRRIVRIKNKYGLIGIAMVTPLLLSIPVGAFLIERYFGKKKFRITYMALSNLVWSVIYACFYGLCYDIYLNIFVL